jgi:hypothetical protein
MLLAWLLAGFLAGFRVEFSEFCEILMTDSLSLLVFLVYLNLVRIRLLQYLSTKEILPLKCVKYTSKKTLSSKRPDFGQNRPDFGQKRLSNG